MSSPQLDPDGTSGQSTDRRNLANSPATTEKTAYLADADPNRAHLDHRLICDLLNLDQSTYQAVRQLAAKWCAEPSVHGGKARPPGATLVV